jgi:hypothetical protein
MAFWRKDNKRKKRRGSNEGVNPVGLQIGEDGVEPAANLPGGMSVSSDGDFGYRSPGSSTSFDLPSRGGSSGPYHDHGGSSSSGSYGSDSGSSSYGSSGSSGGSSYDSGSSSGGGYGD